MSSNRERGMAFEIAQRHTGEPSQRIVPSDSAGSADPGEKGQSRA